MIFTNRRVLKNTPNTNSAPKRRKRQRRKLPLPLQKARTAVRKLRRNLNRSKIPLNNNGRPRTIIPRAQITPDGLAFLKCAFAPPDFQETGVRGVPDAFRGRTLLKKHRSVSTYSVVSGLDYYFLLLPTPGIAYWTTTVSAGTPLSASTVFTAIPYSDCTQLFANVDLAADIINSYRMISNHIEFISTTNAMSYSGTINCFKFQTKLINRGVGVNDIWGITGLQSVNSNLIPMYSGSTFNGVYAGAYNNQADFPFEPILERITNATIPAAVSSSDWGTLNASGIGVFPGLSNSMEAICLRITSATTTNSFIVKSWACVEYTPLANSTLMDYTNVSPACDPIAMKAYREIILSLPVAVPAGQNADFWQRVLRVLRIITGVGSNLPGPYGMMSAGVNTVLGGIQELTI